MRLLASRARPRARKLHRCRSSKTFPTLLLLYLASSEPQHRIAQHKPSPTRFLCALSNLSAPGTRVRCYLQRSETRCVVRPCLDHNRTCLARAYVQSENIDEPCLMHAAAPPTSLHAVMDGRYSRRFLSSALACSHRTSCLRAPGSLTLMTPAGRSSLPWYWSITRRLPPPHASFGAISRCGG